MAGSVLVFLAIAGGAVFLAAALRRRVAETVPLSVLFLIAHTYLCAQLGLLRFSIYVSVFGMIGLGVIGGYLSLRNSKRWAPRWDSSLLFFGLSLIWLLYISHNRLPLLQEDYTQWALMAREMFYTGSLTPAAGTLFYAPAMAVFQTVFQACNALFAPGDGFADWLLYAAYGTACLALLLPLVTVSHPNRWVRAGYTLLFFLAAVCLPLHAFDLFSALNPDGFLAILAAAALWAAVRDKSVPQAIIVGGYLFVLALAKDAGVFLALGVLGAYLTTLVRAAAYRQSDGKRRFTLIAVPTAALLLARLSWPHLSAVLHGATPGMLPLFWQSVTARVVSYRVALAVGGTTVFTVFSVYASFLFLTGLLAGITALLLRALRAKEDCDGPPRRAMGRGRAHGAVHGRAVAGIRVCHQRGGCGEACQLSAADQRRVRRLGADCAGCGADGAFPAQGVDMAAAPAHAACVRVFGAGGQRRAGYADKPRFYPRQ